MKIAGQLRHDIIEHYLENETTEVCGVIVDGKYVRVANVCETEVLLDENEEPVLLDGEPVNKALDNFEFSKADTKKYIIGKKASAIVHSHVNGKMYPSVHDQQQQIATGIPWVIVGRNGVGAIEIFHWGEKTILDSPLYEREFRHGVTDCYEAVRSYFWQEKGVLMPAWPREDHWWKLDDDLYIANYKEQGFREVDLTTELPLKDDVFICKLGSTKYNHAGIHLGGGKGYHHRVGRLSNMQAIGHYRQAGLKFFRYEK